MSGSYGQLRQQYNTLLALDLGSAGGGASATLQQVLDNGNTAAAKDVVLSDASFKIWDGLVVFSELAAGTLALTDDLTYTTFLSQDGLQISNPTGASLYRSSYLEFAGGLGLFTDSLLSSMQLLNPIGNVDITGLTVSILGVPYSEIYARTDGIGAGNSSGRIVFPTPFSVMPSVVICQQTNGNVIGLAITDITLIDFGWKSTAIGVGSIAWTAK